DPVQPSADEARKKSDWQTDRERNGRRDRDNREGHSGAPDDPAQYILAGPIDAHHETTAGGRLRIRHLRVRIERREERCEDGHDDDREYNPDPDPHDDSRGCPGLAKEVREQTARRPADETTQDCHAASRIPAGHGPPNI